MTCLPVPDPRRWDRQPGDGAYARCERERRFLVRGDPVSAEPSRLIEDRYLTGTTLRLRRMTVGAESVWKLTQKVRPLDADDPSDVRITNTYLSAEEHALLSSLPGVVLTKTRSLHPSGRHVLVVDEFLGRLRGLRLAELEVRELDEPVRLPDWIGREVTRDDRFSGGRLAAADDQQVRQLLEEVRSARAGTSPRV